MKILASEGDVARDPILAEFARAILLSGNGTLLINNTFVEWATVQAVRRARPSVAVVSFGIRNKVKPFSSLLIYADQEATNPIPSQMDTLGSYVDLEIFYQYIWQEFQKYAEYRNNTAYLFVGDGMEEMLALGPPDFPLLYRKGSAEAPGGLSAFEGLAWRLTAAAARTRSRRSFRDQSRTFGLRPLENGVHVGVREPGASGPQVSSGSAYRDLLPGSQSREKLFPFSRIEYSVQRDRFRCLRPPLTSVLDKQRDRRDVAIPRVVRTLRMAVLTKLFPKSRVPSRRCATHRQDRAAGRNRLGGGGRQRHHNRATQKNVEGDFQVPLQPAAPPHRTSGYMVPARCYKSARR